MSHRRRLEIFEASWDETTSHIKMCTLDSTNESAHPGGGGTPLHGLYRYVRVQRVWFFSRFGHNILAGFGHFGHK